MGTEGRGQNPALPVARLKTVQRTDKSVLGRGLGGVAPASSNSMTPLKGWDSIHQALFPFMGQPNPRQVILLVLVFLLSLRPHDRPDAHS